MVSINLWVSENDFKHFIVMSSDDIDCNTAATVFKHLAGLYEVILPNRVAWRGETRIRIALTMNQRPTRLLFSCENFVYFAARHSSWTQSASTNVFNHLLGILQGIDSSRVRHRNGELEFQLFLSFF